MKKPYITAESGRDGWRLVWFEADGSRASRFYKNKSEADAGLRRLANVGKRAASRAASLEALPEDFRHELFRCFLRADAGGYEIADALTHYERHLASIGAKPIRVDGAVDECLDDKKNEGISPRSLQSLRSVLNRFKVAKRTMPIADVATDDVREFVDAMRISLRTRLGYLTDLRTFFSWAMQRGYRDSNPVIAAMPGKASRRKIMEQKRSRRREQVLTVDECRALLHYCVENEPTLIPHVALCLFVGLRPEREAPEIEMTDINGKHVTVDASIAKDGETRIIEPLTPNFVAWMKFAKAKIKRPLPVRNLKRKMDEAKESIGRRWPHDAMRHTYASYHFAMFKDAGLTAKNLGHPNATLLRKDYNNAVTEDEARAFWAIVPEGI